MYICEKACWILLDGFHLKARTCVDSIIQHSRCERSCDTALAISQAFANVHWVGERDSSEISVSVVVEQSSSPAV